MKSIINNFHQNHIPYTNIEDVLAFANVKLGQNLSQIFYIINVSITSDPAYEEFLLKPTKKKNFTTKVNSKYILRQDEMYFGMENRCKSFNNLFICKSTDIVNLVENTCIPRKLQGKPSICNKTNVQHIPPVEELSAGIVLLNDFKGEININGSPRYLKGTFLIKYRNTSIRINNQEYVAAETVNLHIIPPLFQTGKDDLEDILSLEMLKELHVNNTRQIKLIETEKRTNQRNNYAIFAVILTDVTITKFISMFTKNTGAKARIPDTTSAESNLPAVRTRNEQYPEASDRRYPQGSIYSIPFF
ncbi:unnamed protein product [Hermetia illucens]|uniref:Uncharacterized protein n=1 Tax=Hermetia illucens TaxID=343691 RepID=A0A7R8YTL2_HERIL|nr:unnamed protein product [Hermetia illucens]